METWKDIAGYEGRYQISNLGRAKSLERRVRIGTNIRTVKEIILKPQGDRYLMVRLDRFGLTVHRLVALAFIPNPHNYKTINHIDGNRYNNRIENLEWCTHSHNSRHAYRLGLMNIPKGDNHYTRNRKKDPVTKRWVA